MSGNGGSSAIRLTVGSVETKAKVISDKTHHPTYSSDTYDFIEDSGFNISAYVTDKWRVDVVGQSPEIAAGLFKNKDNQALENVKVTYSSSRSEEKWRITGNEDYDSPKFTWVNGVPMNFFAYAPIPENVVNSKDYSLKGALTISKETTSTDANYPFTYTAKAATGTDDVPSTNCDDLIFAFASNTATFGDTYGESDYGKLKSGSTDKISLTFHHALAQIRFCIDPADFTTGNIKLISAELFGPASTTPGEYMGIAASGSCTFNENATNKFVWTLGTDRYSYSQTFGTSGVSFSSGLPDTKWTSSTYGTSPDTKTLYTCTGDVLLVIPQSLTDCKVQVCIKVGDADPVYLKGNLPPTGSTGNVYWDAGNYYTYKISPTGTQDDLSLSMTLVDWAERENYVPIG